MREAERRAIYDRDGGVCGFCGEPVVYEEMHLDHVRARGLGGPTTFSNLRPAHARCNIRGGTEVRRMRAQMGLPPQIEVMNVRNIDPDLHRDLRIECATQNITLAILVDRMWQAYEQSSQAMEGAR